MKSLRIPVPAHFAKRSFAGFLLLLINLLLSCTYHEQCPEEKPVKQGLPGFCEVPPYALVKIAC